MPISLSAKKSLRVAKRNKKNNVTFKNKLKSTIKSFLQKPSNEGLKEVYSVIDKAVKRKLFKDNKANRLKAGYSKAVITKSEVKKAVVKKSTAKKAAEKKALIKKTTAKKAGVKKMK